MIKMIQCGYLGTETPYIYEDTKYTFVPLGYKPFFINYLGRHGSSSLTETKELKSLYEALEKAEKAGALKEEGRRLKEKLRSIMSVKGEKEGISMEEGIARRMAVRFPEVFGRKVEAVSTYKRLTEESMKAFLEELGKWTEKERFEVKINGKTDPVLRFFDLNKAYLEYKKDGRWKEMISRYAERKNIKLPIICEFFTERYAEQGAYPAQFVENLYKVYRKQFNAEGGEELGRYFNMQQLRYLWENENLRQYLLKGPSYVGQCLPANISFPLLMDFISTSEKAVNKGELSAYLRFAHAETMIPFTSLLRLLGFYSQINTASHVAVLWQDYWVAPMAANLQWIFYKHPGDKHILVKMLYNESEVRLPIRSVYGPYYEWQTLRSFYIKQLQALHLNWKKDLTEMVKAYEETSCYCR